MMFRVLGPLEVEFDTERITLSGVRLRALLTALLMQPNTVVPAYRLAEAVWGDQPSDKTANALHVLVGRLRPRLGPLGGSLLTRPPGYLLAVDAEAVDSECFEAGYRSARGLWAENPGKAAALLDEALALWRGPAYGEFADGFARAAATRLEELRVSALEDRTALLLECGSVSEAAASAGHLVAQQPLRERPVELLMRALHADGRVGEALEAYRRHREVLADELGLDPAPGLRELEGRILRDDLVVGSPRRPPTASVAPAGPSRDLPWRPGPMLGRDQDLLLLRECLSEQRMVTLVGPGGVGKTRLALEVAHLYAAETSVWWADLTTVTAARLVDALAEATGADIPRAADPAGFLGAALRAHRGLLCLDNAEVLLDELAPVVERLIEAAPGLVFLATSRERIAVASEHVHVLAPLPLPAGGDRDNAAVRLFIDRAPGLEQATLSDDDVSAVAEVCRRLDGLPLAIELGAARAPTFGIREFAARLGKGLDLLAGGRRTAAARHRTLRAVVDWSHGLLTEQEARLFARLAVFPGLFSLDQCESVCADEQLAQAAVAPVLARLVEQSMVQAGRERFWLLETLRTYAAERLDPGERLELHKRHAHDTARRLAVLAGQLMTEDEAEAVSTLADLGADLHAAWTYAAGQERPLAVSLAADIYLYAYLRQRMDLLEWGLQVAGWDIDHASIPQAHAAAAAAAWAAGRLAEGEELTGRGIAAAGGEDCPAAARAVIQRANLAMFQGRNAEAVDGFRRGAALHRAAGEPTLALLGEISVAQALTYAGKTGEAAARMDDLLPQARDSGNPSAQAWAHYVAGEAVSDFDVPRALVAYAAAIEHGTKADSRLFVTLARSSSVELSARHGPAGDALQEFERVMGQWEDLGNEAAQWWVLLNLMILLARVGSDRDAALLAGALLATRDRHPAFTRDVTRFEQTLARVRDRLGRSATEDAIAEGAALSYPAAVAHARRAIRTAGQAIPADR